MKKHITTKRKSASKPPQKPKRQATALVKRSAAIARPAKPPKAERPESVSLAGLTPAVSMSVMGMSGSNFTPAQREALTALMPDEWIDLLPSGEAYSAVGFIRQRLNDVFGVGNWGLADEAPQIKGNNLVVRCTLLVNRIPVGSTYGEAKYSENNKRGSWGKSLESAKSNAIMRCSKDLGIGIKQFWNRRWQFQYRMTHGVLVKVKDYRGDINEQWRHIDAPPYEGEIGISPNSPNQERYVMPSAARRAAAVAYHERTDKDEDVAQAAELRAASQALVPATDGPIDNEARRQLFASMKSHGRTEVELRAFLKAEFGFESTRLIQRSQFRTVKEWLQAPWDVDRVVDGEVRE